MMKADEELIHYLSESLDTIKRLSVEAASKNKTKKFKALTSLLSLAEGRITATHAYARAGGYKNLSVVTQRHLYDPILAWFASELKV
tara:strand:+ start:455 stop:715 length:261 start_codon:yes stop_codon:yes gene_type:complete